MATGNGSKPKDAGIPATLPEMFRLYAKQLEVMEAALLAKDQRIAELEAQQPPATRRRAPRGSHSNEFCYVSLISPSGSRKNWGLQTYLKIPNGSKATKSLSTITLTQLGIDVSTEEGTLAAYHLQNKLYQLVNRVLVSLFAYGGALALDLACKPQDELVEAAGPDFVERLGNVLSGLEDEDENEDDGIDEDLRKAIQDQIPLEELK